MKINPSGYQVQPFFPLVSGKYYTGPHITLSNSSYLVLDDTFVAYPFWLPVAASFDRMGTRSVVAPTTSGTARFGVYRDDGTCYPGDLVQDIGDAQEQSLLGAEGDKLATVSWTLPPDHYWLAFIATFVGGSPSIQGCVATQMLNLMGLNQIDIAATTSLTRDAAIIGSYTWAPGDDLPTPFPTAGMSRSAGTASTALLPLIVLRAL